MKDHHWKTLSSKLIFENPWLKLTEEKVLDDLGNEKNYGLVSMIHGVSVLPIDQNGDVYLVKQYRYGLKDFSIEPPGGAIDPGETPLEAAKRELFEELGITSNKWIPLGYACGLTSAMDHKEHLFLVEIDANDTLDIGTHEENLELIKVPLKKAVEMVQKSEIVLALSTTLIYKAYYYLTHE